MIKDSGTRREFAEGGVRDMGDGKGRFDLIPWDVIWALAKHYEEGAKKYAENNWKSLPTWTFKDSGMRHLAKHIMGHDDEDHLIAAIWNLVSLYHLEHQSTPYKANTQADVQSDVCEICGVHTKTYVRADLKHVCAKCWNKEEDDLK